MASDTPIFTIGYGARDIDEFLRVLRRYEIAYLVDVRSKPYSRYKPDFSKDTLDSHLRRAGIRYVFMGDSLGGRPEDTTCYDAKGNVDYELVAQRAFYQEGLIRLAKAYTQGLRVTLMCSEGKPENCHRSKLIARSLEARGIVVSHIDEQDDLIGQDEVVARLHGGQQSLFGDELLPGKSRKRYRRAAADEEE